MRLDLRFTRTTDRAETATLPLKVGPGPDQSAALIGQVRQLDLQTAFAGARPGAENLKDQSGSVDDLAMPGALEIALLNRRQRAVDNQQIDIVRRRQIAQFRHLAGTEQGAGPGLDQRRRKRFRHLQANCDGKADGLSQTRASLAAVIVPR